MSHHTSSLAHASFFFNDIVDALLAPKHRLPLHLSSFTCRYIFRSRPRSPWHDIRLKVGSLRLVFGLLRLCSQTQRRVRAMVPINPVRRFFPSHFTLLIFTSLSLCRALQLVMARTTLLTNLPVYPAMSDVCT
jgi:hypothetical protein